MLLCLEYSSRSCLIFWRGCVFCFARGCVCGPYTSLLKWRIESWKLCHLRQSSLKNFSDPFFTAIRKGKKHHTQYLRRNERMTAQNMYPSSRTQHIECLRRSDSVDVMPFGSCPKSCLPFPQARDGRWQVNYSVKCTVHVPGADSTLKCWSHGRLADDFPTTSVCVDSQHRRETI